MHQQKAIFIIESPLQLLNAIEAYYHFQLTDAILVIIYNENNKNTLQINKLAKSNKIWRKIIKIFPQKYKYLKFRTTKNITKTILKKKKYFKSLDYLFLGDSRPDFMKHLGNTITANALVLLDDGTATIELMNSYCHKKQDNLKLFIKHITKKYLLNLKIETLNNIKFFTVYNNPFLKESIITNTYSHLKNTQLVQKKVNPNIVYFLGSNIVESNSISFDAYLYYLQKVESYFKNKNIYYLPHRRESEKKLALLTERLNFTITKPDTIIEFYLINNVSVLPGTITGFLCSALINLKYIFEDQISILSFFISPEDFSPKKAFRFNEMYSYYKKYISVIDDLQ